MSVNITDVAMQYQEELLELQNDESFKTLFNIKNTMVWHCDSKKNTTFNAVNVLLLKK